jgi:putative ABC transport system permease protein
MPIHLTEGRFPEKDGEIVISQELITPGGVQYQIGQTITFDIGHRVYDGRVLTDETYEPGEVLEPVTVKTFTITGLIEKPRFESYHFPGYTAITCLDHDKLTTGDFVNVSILGKKPGDIFEKAPEIAGNSRAASVSYNYALLRWLGVTPKDNAIRFLYWTAFIIIMLVVVGSVTVIYNAFAISVNERVKQFGMLASIGATPQQIRKIVFYEGIILGLAGIPFGILSGLAGIGITLKIVNNLLLNTLVQSPTVDIRLMVSPAVIGVSVFFVGLVIFLSAYIPSRKAAKVSPLDAIRLSADITVKEKDVKTSKLTKMLFGVEGTIALKNLKRNRNRYRATLFSLVISIVLFVSFSSLVEYAFTSSAFYYRDSGYDLLVSKYDTPYRELKGFFEKIDAMDGVDKYSIIRTIHSYATGLEVTDFSPYVQKNLLDTRILSYGEDGKYMAGAIIATINHEQFQLYAEETGLDIAGYYDTTSPKCILINRNMIARRIEYKLLKTSEGHTLNLADPHAGAGPSSTFSLEIGAITQDYPFEMAPEEYHITILVSEPVFETIWESYLATDANRRDHEAIMCIKTDDTVELTQQIRNLSQQYTTGLEHGDHEHNLYIQDLSILRRETSITKTIISIFLYGFVTLITLIGITNIFNTISTNVALRRREFAILKSVGLTPRGFNKMINYESIFYGLKALSYGLPISCLISIWLFYSFNHLFRFVFVLPWKEIFICIGGVFVIVSATMFYSSSKFKKENIVDALKQENL